MLSTVAPAYLPAPAAIDEKLLNPRGATVGTLPHRHSHLATVFLPSPLLPAPHQQTTDSDVAGLGRRWDSRGWDRIVVAPAAGAHPNVTSASASIDAPSGFISVDWTQRTTGGGDCGVAPENSDLTLSCVAAGAGTGVFTGVTFASFGTPTGSCPRAGPFTNHRQRCAPARCVMGCR